jgi:hypothetical protein
MAQRVVTVNDVLDGHVALDIECLDRIYLNAYVPVLQTSSQVVAFLSGHLGFPFPSPVLFRQLGERFRRAVASFAEAHDIPWVRFGTDEAKLEVMQPHLARQANTGRPGVAAIGVAQEFQRVWTAYEGKTSTGTPRWSFVKTDRRVTCYYFYLWDEDFGPAFIKVCAYFPYPAKIWVNGHEWVKRQAARAGIGFTALSNGFAACGDPAALQAICDRLQPGTIEVFAQRWLHQAAQSAAFRAEWDRWNPGVRLDTLNSPHRSLVHPIVDYVRQAQQANRQIAVLIPEVQPRHWRYRILQNQRGLLLATVLRTSTDVVICTIPHRLTTR